MATAAIRLDVALGGLVNTVAVRSSRQASHAGSTAVSVTAPAGTVDGDLVIVVVSVNGTATTIADNNGATPFTEDLVEISQGTHCVSVFSRRIVTGDPATYAFTLGSSQRWTVTAVTFQKPHASNIYDVAPAYTLNPSGTAVSAPSITTLTADAIHCAVATVDGDTFTFTSTPTGYTVAQNGGNQVTAFTYKTFVTPGVTGAQSFTHATASSAGISFAIASPAIWTDITTDMVSSEGVRCRRGITGSGPKDRVATTGTMEFTLRNDTGCSGGVRGYYSPNHTSVRAGWTFGIPVRLIATYSGIDYPIWRGRVRSIMPTAGQRLQQRVAVAAYDSMGDLGDARVRAIEPQVNQTESALLQSVLDAVSPDSQPHAIYFDAGLDTFAYAFNDIGRGASAMGLVSDVVLSSLGKLFTLADGTLRYENRQSLATEDVSATFTDADLFYDGLNVPSTIGNVYNRVRVTIHPRTVDGNDETVLYRVQYTNPPSLGPGESATLWGEYQDPANVLKLIGGTDHIVPISGTDYVANSQPDGLGIDLTSSVSVVTQTYASSVKFVISNASSITAYFTTLQIRGRGIYDETPVTVESYTAQSYGDRPMELDLPYQDNPTLAQGLADYVKSQYLALDNQAESLSITPQRSAALMVQALEREICDVVLVSETMTGLTALEVVIQGIEWTLGSGPWICRWTVAPSLTSDFWVLDDPTASVLGSTTVPGYI